MLLRILLFTLVAMGMTAFGCLVWIGMQNAGSAAHASADPARVATQVVLVAAHPLRAGNLLKPDDLAPLEVPVSDVKPGARPNTPQAFGELLGAMIRRSLVAGETVMPADVLRPGDHGFLAAVLGSGMRAVTVGVDAVSGTAGLIWPGDSVDLILTMDDSTMAAGHRVSGETMMHAVRVIAIDQQMVQGADSSNLEAPTARTVTLEVSPAQAERVQVAVRLGKLSLCVVSAEDALKVDASQAGTSATTVTWGGDVSSALRQQDSSDVRTMRVFHGTAEGKEFHF